MSTVREYNIKKLQENGYGVEERKLNDKTVVDLYSPKYLYIDYFEDHDDLHEWIKRNVES